jgi:hypothetical protein
MLQIAAFEVSKWNNILILKIQSPDWPLSPNFSNHIFVKGTGPFRSVLSISLTQRVFLFKNQKIMSKACANQERLIPKGLRLDLSQTLGHEVEEGELAGLVAVCVNETAGQVTAEDGAEVVLGDL